MKRNLILFRVDNFLSGLWPLSAVAVIYFQQITNSYTLAMLVFSIINIVQTLFEVPTGVLSDKIGRKKTIILSNLLILSGYILWALAGIKNMHYLLYLGSFLVGSGNALLSGTDDAMVFETLKDMDKEDEFDKFFSKNRSYNELGIAIGATIATFVYFYYPISALAFLAIFPPLLQVIISFLYIEPKNTTRPDSSFLLHLVKATKLLLKNKNLFKFALIKSLNDSLNAVNWRFIGAYYEQVIAPWMINIVRIS